MNTWHKSQSLDELLPDIPPIPVVVRYYDDFSDSYGELTDAETSAQWVISCDGRRMTLTFERFDIQVRRIVKSWCATILAELSPRTVQYYYYGLAKLDVGGVSSVLAARPQEVRSLWKQLHAADLTVDTFVALHSLMYFCCKFSIGSWGPEWTDALAQLPLPKVDKYASVRTGAAFLDVHEEQAIVLYLDRICVAIISGTVTVSDAAVRSAAILACSYQFGVRSKQIAMLRMRDIRIWQDGVGTSPAVHLTFTMIKQRSGRAFPLVRRTKREWTPIFTELLVRAQACGLAAADHILASTPSKVSTMIGDLTENLLETPRSTMELRHTAAQRLVDAGANEEELAAYLGHSDLNTGLMYFRSSNSQAERVNRALGISAVYQKVARIARDRFISVRDLCELKGEQQVAGVPHGIPIAGIGGCSTGQPSCPYNPVLSCYGCNKFMPVTDSSVHERVLEDLRGVVKVFYAASRGERGSPAFQMEQTISNVQAVLAELGANDNELLP